jgi:hypothetical protein
MTAAYIAEACRLYVLLVLAAAAAGKAMAMREFEETVADLFGVDARLARTAAFAIVAAEALVALALLAGGGWARAGMAAALALFVTFTAAILIALIQHRQISCNCFGGRGHPISGHDLVRNGALIAACGVYLRYVPAGHSLDAPTWLLLFGIALIWMLISTNLNEIVALAR